MNRITMRRSLILFAVVALMLGTVIVVANGVDAETSAPPPIATQIPYSHQVHVQNVGIQCLFCHSKAISAPQASLPSLQTCMICHAYVTVAEEAQPQVDQLVHAYENGERVQWPDVYRQPDYVYFNHRPHVAKGIACETCHGDVKNMELVEATININMGFCLDCHRNTIAESPDLPEPQKARLTDCVTCHK